MKFLTASRRDFPAIGAGRPYVDYLGTGLTTKEVNCSNGYQGRGIPTTASTFPAGTSVKFSLKEVAGKAYLSIEIVEYPTFHKNYDFTTSLEEVTSKYQLDRLPDYFESLHNIKGGVR